MGILNSEQAKDLINPWRKKNGDDGDDDDDDDDVDENHRSIHYFKVSVSGVCPKSTLLEDSSDHLQYIPS
jgi:hypothetical protein